MKKNIMARIASVLLAAVLLSSYAISGTFAKYAFQSTAADSACVAKWGIKIILQGRLFSGNCVETQSADTESTVALRSSGKYTDAVAPGTSSDDQLFISLNGTAEVACSVYANLKIANLFLSAGSYLCLTAVDDVDEETDFDTEEIYYYPDNDRAGSDVRRAAAWLEEWNSVPPVFYSGYTVNIEEDYYPIIFTMEGDTSYSEGTHSENSLKGVADAVAAKLNMHTGDSGSADGTVVYSGVINAPANKDFADFGLTEEYINWSWDFDGSNDDADTILGIMASRANDRFVLRFDDTPDNNCYKELTASEANAELIFNFELEIKQDDTYTPPTSEESAD